MDSSVERSKERRERSVGRKRKSDAGNDSDSDSDMKDVAPSSSSSSSAAAFDARKLLLELVKAQSADGAWQSLQAVLAIVKKLPKSAAAALVGGASEKAVDTLSKGKKEEGKSSIPAAQFDAAIATTLALAVLEQVLTKEVSACSPLQLKLKAALLCKQATEWAMVAAKARRYLKQHAARNFVAQCGTAFGVKV